MTIAEAVKRNEAYATLKNEAKNAAQSYMFVSSDGITNEMLAKYFVSFLAGKSVEQVEELADVYFLPLGEKMLISDANFLTETVNVMPVQLSKKYFIVNMSEGANEATQNKMLKTLEEPPETATIILLCSSEYAILPTVKSRCRKIYPKGYDDETLRSVIDTEFADVNNPSFAVAASGGNLQRLASVALEGTEAFDRALNILNFMRKSSQILPYATQLIARKEKLPLALDALELLLRDCMVAPSKPQLIKLKDNVMDIRELSGVYTSDVVIKVLPLIARARKRLSLNGNINSIVDELLFSILEEKAKCQK